MTSIVVTHDMRTVERVADRVLMLAPASQVAAGESQILFEGTARRPDGLQRSPRRSIRVRQSRRTDRGVVALKGVVSGELESGERIAQARLLPRLSTRPSPNRPSPLCPMSERQLQFRVGVFVIVATVATVMMVFQVRQPAEPPAAEIPGRDPLSLCGRHFDRYARPPQRRVDRLGDERAVRRQAAAAWWSIRRSRTACGCGRTVTCGWSARSWAIRRSSSCRADST